MRKIWIALFAIAVIVAVIAGAYLLKNSVQQNKENATAGSTKDLPISMQQREEAIAIALNDSRVKDGLLHIGLGVEYADTGTLGNGTISYSIGDITTLTFHETYPGVNLTKSLPAVELIAGNGNESGVNVYAFVNLSKKRVEYVGFTPREGRKAHDIIYSSYGNGVEEHFERDNSSSYLDNVTIIDTGIEDYQHLTDEQKAMIVGIALNNATVKEYLNGYRYDTYVMSASSGGNHYWVSYPIVRISVWTNVKDQPDYYLFVSVNLKENKVYVERWNSSFVRPPQYPF